MKRKFDRSTFVPALMMSGATAMVATSTLPQKDWKVHSGKAPVSKEEVHSLKSQMIAGTKTLVIQADSGKQLSVTAGEAEIFAVDYLADLGYTVKAPAAAA